MLKDIRQSDRIRYVMQGGRLFDVPTMNEVGARPKARKPFFFEGAARDVAVDEHALGDASGYGHVCNH